ncbi:MAG: lamin tail domain-containing protein, partial [Flavobacteriales bacterium]|nr:lamin tail domain-containing protein [Flavobacteriales bacterium]
MATTIDANLESSSLVRGSGVVASTLTNAFSASGWDAADLAGAIANEEFFEFAVEAASGYAVSLSTLDANFRRSGTGPNAFQWQYSLDGFATSGSNIGAAISFTGSGGNGTVQGQLNLSVLPALQDVAAGTVITIRLYGWGASGEGGTFAIGRLPGNDLAIGGTVDPAGAPTTSVAFTSATSSAGEADGTVDLVLSITDPSSTNATSVDVVLASGDAARIGNYTTQTVTWPANDATDKTLTITITDNAACDGDAELGFQLQNATGGDDAEVGANDAHALTIVDDEGAPLPAPVATAATAIGDNGFTANWEAVTGATGYFLDVYSSNAVPATDLFISEYIEGSGNNKYIEVFNGTGTTVDLSDYEVLVFFNGSPTAGNTIPLIGTLADGDVHVLAHNSADITGAPVDQTAGNLLNFNGDDAVALWKISTASYVDIFGTIGEDPGSAWTGGGLSTVNRTLVRKSDVTGGVTTNPGSGFPTLVTEWDGFPEDNIDDLGSHTYDGSGTTLYVLENESVGNVLTYPVTGLDPGVTYYYVVRAANACATSDDSNVQEVTTTVPVVPVLTAVPDALDFGDVVFGTTSASMSFELSGTDLEPVSGSVSLEVPPGLEVELSLSEVLWETEVSVPYTGGELLPVTVYVRFSPSAIGAQSDAIAISGGGAVTAVNITGTGAEAQIYWDFQTETPTLDLVPFTSTSAISRGQHNNTFGDLVNGTSPSDVYPGASGQNNAAASAFTGPLDPGTSTYFEFTVTTAPGHFTHFHTFSFGSRSTGTGPQGYSVRWDVDGYASDLFSGTLDNSSTWTHHTYMNLGVITPVGGPVSFRIYGHSGTGNPGTSANWRIDDLALYGDSYEAASIYYSRATGTADQPIWSDTPTGTAGPAVFGPGVGMVVQAGDAVTVTASMAIGTLEVESGATLELNSGTTFDLHGDALIDGDLVANESEIALVGADGVILQSAGTLDLYDLTVNTPNGALTDAVITVRGTLQLTDGEFESVGPITLVSDENGTAQLGPVGTDAEYVGALTVQRYIPGGATNWRLLGSPVAGATVNGWMDDFFTAGFPGSHYPEFYDTQYGGYEPGANYWPSVRLYDETTQDPDAAAGLIGVESQLTPLSFGRGFAAWSGDNDLGTAGFTVDVTGAPHVAKTPAALPVSWTELSPADPAAQGWNLVSNPLPAPIDFSLMVRGADVANGYYVYDPATGNNAHWDAEILVSTPPGAVHGIIHSSQGFWVQASGPAATLTVDESAKVDVATGGLFGGDQMPTVGQLRLVIENGANAMRDEARVYFGLGQPGHDAGDALKLPVGHQHAPRIATRSSDGMDMMVNKYGAHEQAISIPVTVR